MVIADVTSVWLNEAWMWACRKTCLRSFFLDCFLSCLFFSAAAGASRGPSSCLLV